MYPKVFDLYNHCSDDLKKSLDIGREFEQKIRVEEDNLKLEGKRKQAEEFDKEMKGEKESATEEERETQKLVGQALKKKQKEDEEKKHDEVLYR